MQQHKPIPGIPNNRVTRFLSGILDFLNTKESFYYLISLAVFIRIMFLGFWPTRTTADSFVYIAQAEAILNGSPFPVFPNGYPLLISGILTIAGKTHLYFALLVINLLVQLFTGVIVYKTGHLLFRSSEDETSEMSAHKFAILSLFIFVFYPTQVLFTSYVLTESVTTFLLITSVYLLLKRNYAYAGMLLALAAQLRTVYLPAIFLTAIVVFVIQRRHFLRYVSGAALISALFFGLDLIKITAFPINQSYNLLIAINGYSPKVNHNLSNFAPEAFISPLTTYITFALEHPAEFLLQRISALYELWGPYSFEPNNRLLRILFGVRFLLFVSWIYMAYLILVKKWIIKGGMQLCFFSYISALAVTITVIHTIYFSGYRFIVPLEPLMILLAVSAARTWYHRRTLSPAP
ncbi:MAG: hypothetical protein FMNOHCHN_00966 [Ignavibacteriaceae bacterium]|nr:hypothetical protein [Ignavibacteriaceae bacterium]